MKPTESNSVNLDKPLAESAVAPGECGRTEFEIYANNMGIHDFERSQDGGDGYSNPYTEGRWIYWVASRDALGMQPPNNQPNSDHLAVPVETATDTRLRGSHIQNSWSHNAGAYARCSYCRRYSDNPNAITQGRFMCDCGKDTGWCGSFERPTAKSTWSGPESGISSLVGRPNEKDVIGEGK